MSDAVENPVINLKLLIDTEKYKVVLAEASKDFVDILFSFLTWPMGSIAALMEMHQYSQPIGCVNNIYKSVESMDMKHFRTEACKQMLLSPVSVNHKKYQKIKLNIYNSEATKCFMCPMYVRSGQCSQRYSNFNTSRCSCGKLMEEVIQCQGEGGRSSVGNRDESGAFVNCDYTSFIITDDLKVEVNSVGLILTVLKDLGYTYCDNLVEVIVDVNLDEAAFLWECLFGSDTPLTDVFLKGKCSYDMKRIHKTLSTALLEDRKESKADQTIMLTAYVGKKEGNIIFVECGEDFVDLLFTFLAMPLDSVWGISGNEIILGCIGNLCRSFTKLSVDSGREAKCVLPHYYNCQKQLLDVVTTLTPPTYYRYVSFSVDHFREYLLSENSGKPLVYDWDELVPVISIDPKSESHRDTSASSTTPSGGFMKRETVFMVTDDLIITPSNSISTIGLLKEKQIQLDDVDVQLIIITKEEAIRLLKASLVINSALSTGLLAMKSASTSVPQSRVFKKPKIET